ncbi:hypothetical protein ACFYZE_35985 [Streptomyces sp. NPDC001796]|uniref:hypothetical protein n=1 Tax=Streptomyces sp. NPDC001796 TaxID=3364609 RepID=UPI003680B522
MAETVQDGGERGVQDGADRLEAVTASLGFETAGVHHRDCRDVGTGAGSPPDGGSGAVTRYPPRRVHRPDWLPGRAPNGQVIACVVPSGSAQTLPS